MEYVMQLYFAPGACSLASHITAREAGINIDLKRADTKTKKLEDGSDYLAVNSGRGAGSQARQWPGAHRRRGHHAVPRRPETGEQPRAEKRHVRALSRAGMAQL